MGKKIFKFGLIGMLLLFIIGLTVIFIIPDTEYNAALVYPPEVSESMKKKLLSEFGKKKIPYRVKEGVIYYPKKYDKVAFDISDEVIFGKNSVKRTKFTYREHKEYFIELLEKANIPYRIKIYRPQGDEWILWNIEDDDGPRHPAS